MKNLPVIIFLSASASALLAFPAISLAQPSVSGNTVTWPSDGWYQVQQADTFVTVCQGGDSSRSSLSGGPCVIGAGNHIVINHSNGQRFNNITAAAPSVSTSAVTVNGSTISWPDDGWYQVQNADNFSTVCEGGTSCTVEPGNYVLINHSTQQRFNDIVVGSSGSSRGNDNTSSSNNVVSGSAVTSVVADGNTIRWPNDGWYQVQNADTFASICEGGTECQVAPGNYVVINHSTGQRLTLSVGGNSSSGNRAAAPSAQIPTRVDFNITVPVYVSDSLQVQLRWGGENLSAGWVVDETWRASGEFASDTENLLSVNFVDRNGEIVLGSFERSYRTGTSASEVFEISADQFDTTRWDDDGDGVSNLDESIAGSDPLDASDTARERLIRANFGINVPAFMSDELQVRLNWGDTEFFASWVGDESWSAFADLPADTERPFTVTFLDQNGGLVLGNYKTTHKTGTNDSDYRQVENFQINTNRFDNDLDGVSNISELQAGTNPNWPDSSRPITFTSVKETLDWSCVRCHQTFATHSGFVGRSRVIPFDPDNSFLVQKMEGFDAEGVRVRGTPMTFGGSFFVQQVRAWIATGALDN